MAKYSNTKAKINEKIATNGRQAVTGSILNDVLQTMVDSLGADYQFGGLVQPGSSFTAGEQPVVFLANTPGTYTNFGGLVLADGEVALLVWSGTAWSKQTPDISTRTEVSQLGQELTGVYKVDSITIPGNAWTVILPHIAVKAGYIIKLTVTTNIGTSYLYLNNSDDEHLAQKMGFEPGTYEIDYDVLEDDVLYVTMNNNSNDNVISVTIETQSSIGDIYKLHNEVEEQISAMKGIYKTSVDNISSNQWVRVLNGIVVKTGDVVNLSVTSTYGTSYLHLCASNGTTLASKNGFSAGTVNISYTALTEDVLYVEINCNSYTNHFDVNVRVPSTIEYIQELFDLNDRVDDDSKSRDEKMLGVFSFNKTGFSPSGWKTVRGGISLKKGIPYTFTIIGNKHAWVRLFCNDASITNGELNSPNFTFVATSTPQQDYNDVEVQVYCDGNGTDVFGEINTDSNIPNIKDDYDVWNVRKNYVRDVDNQSIVAINTNSDFIFIINTDIHISTQTANFAAPVLNVVNRVARNVHPDYIANLGDTVGLGLENPERAYYSLNEVVGHTEERKNAYFVVGNHDYNNLSGVSVERQPKASILPHIALYRILAKQHEEDCVWGSKEQVYYYKDFNDKKIRIIVLNTLDKPEEWVTVDGVEYEKYPWLPNIVSADQVDWLIDTALNFSDKGADKANWSVIIMGHVTPVPGVQGNEASIGSMNNDNLQGIELCKIAKAFKAGTSETLSYTDTLYGGNATLNRNADFTSQGAMNIIGWFSGHAHYDSLVLRDGVNYVVTMCGDKSADNIAGMVRGEYSEFAMDCVLVDKTNRKVNIKRYGFGEDREFTY